MRAVIVDKDALTSITPTSLVAYARSEGWMWVGRYGKHSDIYLKDGAGEIIIPGTHSLGDYADVVSTILSTFASDEERDELQVFQDLSGADRDVIRVRAPDGSDDGSISIDAGVDIFAYSRELLLSAACAAKDPRAAYRAGGKRTPPII